MNGRMGSSQNWGSILVPLNRRCRRIIHNQKGPIIFANYRYVEPDVEHICRTRSGIYNWVS